MKLILIVRDPRAIMYARSQAIWCQESTFCKDESFLCQDMDKDFDKISQLQKDFPNRVSFVRFEDFASLPKRELLNLAEFLDLPSTEEMERYLDKKVSDNGQLLAHNQDTSSNVWQSQMHFTTIERIQTVCQTAMSKWGYKVFNYQDVHPNRAVLPLDI